MEEFLEQQVKRLISLQDPITKNYINTHNLKLEDFPYLNLENIFGSNFHIYKKLSSKFSYLDVDSLVIKDFVCTFLHSPQLLERESLYDWLEYHRMFEKKRIFSTFNNLNSSELSFHDYLTKLNDNQLTPANFYSNEKELIRLSEFLEQEYLGTINNRNKKKHRFWANSLIYNLNRNIFVQSKKEIFFQCPIKPFKDCLNVLNQSLKIFNTILSDALIKANIKTVHKSVEQECISLQDCVPKYNSGKYLSLSDLQIISEIHFDIPEYDPELDNISFSNSWESESHQDIEDTKEILYLSKIDRDALKCRQLEILNIVKFGYMDILKNEVNFTKKKPNSKRDLNNNSFEAYVEDEAKKDEIKFVFKNPVKVYDYKEIKKNYKEHKNYIASNQKNLKDELTQAGFSKDFISMQLMQRLIHDQLSFPELKPSKIKVKVFSNLKSLLDYSITCYLRYWVGVYKLYSIAEIDYLSDFLKESLSQFVKLVIKNYNNYRQFLYDWEFEVIYNFIKTLDTIVVKTIVNFPQEQPYYHILKDVLSKTFKDTSIFSDCSKIQTLYLKFEDLLGVVRVFKLCTTKLNISYFTPENISDSINDFSKSVEKEKNRREEKNEKKDKTGSNYDEYIDGLFDNFAEYVAKKSYTAEFFKFEVFFDIFFQSYSDLIREKFILRTDPKIVRMKSHVETTQIGKETRKCIARNPSLNDNIINSLKDSFLKLLNSNLIN